MPSVESSGKFPTLIPAGQFEHPSLAYIDLDLPDPQGSVATSAGGAVRSRSRSQGTAAATSATAKPSSSSSSSAYKSIDFVKTEAFNRTRHKVEEKYKKEH